MNAEPRLPPERVLCLLQVPEEPGEVDDAGGVRFVELHAAL
jgi:hypothetical protein